MSLADQIEASEKMARFMGDVELYEAIEDEVELWRNGPPHNAVLLAVLRREFRRRGLSMSATRKLKQLLDK